MDGRNITWCAHADVSRSTGQAIEWVATRSLRNQEQLVSEFAAAQIEAAVEPDVVADRLGLTKEQLEDVLKHPVDLTLEELRLLSIAAEVVVTYRVRAAHREYSEQYRTLRRLSHRVRAEQVESESHDEVDDVRAAFARAVARV